MIDRADIEAVLETDVITSLDLDMFDDADIANIILQRSGVLYDVPRGGRIIRQWVDHDPAPLHAVVAEKGHDITRRAIAMLYLEYQDLRAYLAQGQIKRVADIGCGYGFIDLFISRDLGADLLLIDIEESPNRDFGFRDEGAGYSDLQKAVTFLTANGVAADKITAINPNKDDLMATAPVDLAISLLSCGFHYPLATYDTYFAENLKPGGMVVVDIRNRGADGQADAIGRIGTVSEAYDLLKGTKRTLIRKTR
ncbi:class I SAM-dependent methyltransferase [Yoonia sp. 2307UL14-13]|uniref:class I SAM-dependent methyltransferase n=1 Tax=Yoonia sp. 2307UL14-13 TaxID=3126506 RepID=UPI0030A5DB2B